MWENSPSQKENVQIHIASSREKIFSCGEYAHYDWIIQWTISPFSLYLLLFGCTMGYCCWLEDNIHRGIYSYCVRTRVVFPIVYYWLPRVHYSVYGGLWTRSYVTVQGLYAKRKIATILCKNGLCRIFFYSSRWCCCRFIVTTSRQEQ